MLSNSSLRQACTSARTCVAAEWRRAGSAAAMTMNNMYDFGGMHMLAESRTPDELLSAKKLGELGVLKDKLQFCYADDKCKDVLDKIAQHRITCLPVFAKRGTSSTDLGACQQLIRNAFRRCVPALESIPKEEVVGIIDVIDVVKLIARLHGDTRGYPSPTRYAIEWVEWNHAIVEEALVQRKRTPFVLPATASVLDAARVLIDTRIPRILVRDKESNISNVITQSDLVNMLSGHIEVLDPKVLHKPISTFRHIKNKSKDPHHVLKVDKNARAIEAFRMMDYGDVSAVPVVDTERDNKLVANISARDIRGIIAEESDFPMSLYTQTALQFAQRMHARKDTHAPLAVSLRLSDTFKDAITKLNELRIHRVWIVNDAEQVTHVLALCDILGEIIEP